MLTQIYNGHILTPEGWINQGSVVFADGRIVEVSRGSNIVDKVDHTVDAQGMNVVPGGIELHCHGGGGSDYMEGTEEAFRTATRAHMRHGTTAMFPTLSSATLPMIEAACQTCDRLMREPASPIMGLHLEGPYFNPRRAGAQMPDIIRLPDPDEYHHIIEDYECVRRWDAAPELPGALEFARYITSKGVVAAIGLAQVEKADEYRAMRIRNHQLYRKFLSDVPGIRFQAPPAPDCVDVCWMNTIVVDPAVYGHGKDDLIAHLKEQGIDTRLLFTGMHRQKAMRDFGCDCSGDYPVCDWLTENGFYLPSGSNLQEAQIERICDVIRKFANV